MQEIIIDEQFKHLMPALDKETLALLEENILENGCRDALVLWDGILIDGHNRYAICTKHDIPFNTVSKEFSSREEALIWIVSTQISRRNLTPIQLSHFRGLHYRADKKLEGNRTGNNQYGEQLPQNGEVPPKQSTSKRLGEKYKVSKNTIQRDAKLSDALDAIGEVSPEAKSKILSGEVKIEKKALEALASAEKEEIAEVAARIEDGTFEKAKPEKLPADDGFGKAAEASSAGDPADAGRRPVNPLLGALTGVSYQALLRACEKGAAAQAKKALRTYIDMLEGLYAGL